LYQGIIAWQSTGAPPSGADIPDPSYGSYDWIAWLPATANNVSGATAFIDFQFGGNGQQSGPLEISSQRKLPPSVGILYVVSYAGSVSSVCWLTADFRMGLKGDVTTPGLGGG